MSIIVDVERRQRIDCFHKKMKTKQECRIYTIFEKTDAVFLHRIFN
jgi:hypothetical protein